MSINNLCVVDLLKSERHLCDLCLLIIFVLSTSLLFTSRTSQIRLNAVSLGQLSVAPLLIGPGTFAPRHEQEWFRQWRSTLPERVGSTGKYIIIYFVISSVEVLR